MNCVNQNKKLDRTEYFTGKSTNYMTVHYKARVLILHCATGTKCL